ncbi:MAG: hypothetical protein JKY48_19940 [Flavobacteriales bacterium]|nr:hypothetical protein [Flavobacteriales bacterium]
MSKTIFEEKQRFNQWWLWLLIIGSFSFMIYKFIAKDDLIANLPPILILISVVVLFVLIKLKTRIDERGVHIKMFPFHIKTVTYKWEDIYSAETIKYNPLRDFGGWGIRISSKGKAFNVRGSNGIRIVTKSGDTRMIGTQKMSEAKQVIENFKSKIA